MQKADKMNRRDPARVRRPCDALAPFVAYYYHYRRDPPDRRDAARHLPPSPDGLDVLPGTHVRMGIMLEEPTVMCSRAGRTTNPIIGFTGYFTAPVRYTPTGALRLLLVGFTPVGLQQFIDDPVSDLCDRNVGLETLFPRDYERVYHALFSARSVPAKVDVVERFLLEKLHHRHFDRRAEGMARYIRASGGAPSVRALADRFALTERTVQRLFKNNVGVSPKLFCKLARFQKALQRLKHTPYGGLGPLAHELGYFDQAHFIHDVKQLSGKAPTELMAQGCSEMGADFARLRCSDDLIFV